MDTETVTRIVSHQRRLIRYMIAALALMLVALTIALVAWLAHSDDVWNPLGPYPEQVVLNPQRVVDPHGTLEVRAVKCVRADEPVQVRGMSAWTSVLPAGTSVRVPGPRGVGLRLPAGSAPGQGPAPDERGCTTYRYSNPVPLAVQARSAEVCLLTGQPAIWRIGGTETPVRDEGDGVARSWRTQDFRIACT